MNLYIKILCLLIFSKHLSFFYPFIRIFTHFMLPPLAPVAGVSLDTKLCSEQRRKKKLLKRPKMNFAFYCFLARDLFFHTIQFILFTSEEKWTNKKWKRKMSRAYRNKWAFFVWIYFDVISNHGYMTWIRNAFLYCYFIPQSFLFISF
jgi:hypothetical protein